MSSEKATPKITVHPYLSFKGKASEAMDFYAEHLNGKIECKMLYSQGPPPTLEEHKNCVMHGVLSFEGATLMFSDVMGDCGGGDVIVGTNVTINLNWTDIEAMTKAFNGMSAGGKITMPLDKQFWGATYGSFVDKFDIPWSFNSQHEGHEGKETKDCGEATEESSEKKQRVD